MRRVVFHVDANSAYLSWTAVDLLERGYPLDVRTVPAVIAGDPASRHGIILTKSIPAKKYGIGTGESLMEARARCPGLVVLPPDYDLYLKCSEAMHRILSEYSDRIERYSVDESWLDFTDSVRLCGDPTDVAHEIKDRIKDELGFTVNIGVSVNKLLAKMGSELQKPDRVHTLWPHEIEEKLWPLPVGELFFVGRATKRKLTAMNIRTIGELAHTDPALLRVVLKPVHGTLVWQYANGIDDAPVDPNSSVAQKGVGNATTIPYDVTTEKEAQEVLLAICERVGTRLRKLGACASVCCVTIRNSDLFWYRHQKKYAASMGATSEIYEAACALFREMWRGEAVRQLGVHLGTLTPATAVRQTSLFDRADREKLQALDAAVDRIRGRYGEKALTRGVFANTNLAPMLGGVNDGNYLMMGGYSL
ncbi:MAG: DNA polymerase IV [Clostridiales Family XIII bacterium]|jgi:DNA polymerase-4|nr:DNA polymerase IV [Clostridiales Family XIII bacterium]